MSRIFQVTEQENFFDTANFSIRTDEITNTYIIRFEQHLFLFDEDDQNNRVSQLIWRYSNQNDRIYDVSTSFPMGGPPILEHHLSLHEYQHSFEQIETQPNGTVLEIKQIYSYGYQDGGFWLLKVNQNEYIEIYRYLDKLKFSFGVLNLGIQRRNIVRITLV